MKKSMVATAVAFALALTGCQTPITREESGTFIGVLAGGLLGSTIGDGRGQVLATFAGAVLGGLVGSSVGRQLDRYDELQAQAVLEHVPTGETGTWVNPDAGHQVAVTPVNTYQTDSGRYCREYSTSVSIGGKTEQAYGTACRQPDGSWQIQ